MVDEGECKMTVLNTPTHTLAFQAHLPAIDSEITAEPIGGFPTRLLDTGMLQGGLDDFGAGAQRLYRHNPPIPRTKLQRVAVLHLDGGEG